MTFGAQWENVRTSLEIELYLFICVSACLAQDLPQPSFYKTFKMIRLFTWKTSCSFFTPRMRCVLGVRRAGCWAGLLSLRLRHFARRRCIPRDKSWWVQTPCPGLCSHPTSPRLLALERGEAFSRNHCPACGRPPAAGGGSRGSGAASGLCGAPPGHGVWATASPPPVRPSPRPGVRLALSSLQGAGGALVPPRCPRAFWEGSNSASSPPREGTGPPFVKSTKRERGRRAAFRTVRHGPSQPPGGHVCSI